MRRFNYLRLSLIFSLALLTAALIVSRPEEAAAQADETTPALLAPAVTTNGRIAFSTTRDFNSEIYTMNPDGSGQVRLTVNAALDADPAWSPDGTRLLFVSTRDGNEEIYVMNADGSNQTRLTTNAALDRTPVWSPDGAQIAFASNRANGRFDIFLMNADGTNQVNLTNGAGAADFQDPDWSPNGTKLACSQSIIQNNVLGPYGVLVMNADGSGKTRLSAEGNVDINPRWSPDGTRLAFSSNRPSIFGTFEIFVMNADGTNQVAVTTNLGENSRPCWSPDGTRLAFQSSQGPSFDIWLINPDGSGQVRITIDPANEFQPVWQRVQTPAMNPIDDPQLFVRRQYLVFLNREPVAAGRAYWTNQITLCGTDAACISRRRAEVSAAFFIEQEFQQTGYFVYRLYAASYCRRLTFAEYTSDRNKLTVGANLETTKQNLALEFVQRAEFVQKYPLALGGAEFVDALLLTVNTCTGVNLTALRANFIAEHNAQATQTQGRARVLRLVIDNTTYAQAEFNKAFVQAAYFGYLRRDPDAGGFQFWLDVLNNLVPNNYRAMVCAFITSAEYQRRFSPVITRTNAECGP